MIALVGHVEVEGVEGIVAKPELNGTPGLIVGYNDATERYRVRLMRFHSDTKEVALKADNLSSLND